MLRLDVMHVTLLLLLCVYAAGPDGPAGNYDCTETHFVTVIGEQRNKLAVYAVPDASDACDGDGAAAATGQPKRIHVLEGHTRPITWLVVHGAHAFTGSYDFTLRVWDIVSGGPAVHVHTYTGAVLRLIALRQQVGLPTCTAPCADCPCAACCPDRPVDVIVVSTCSEGSLRAYSGDGSVMVGELVSAHSSAILCVEACPCSSRIVTGSRDGSVKVWSVAQCVDGAGSIAVSFLCLAVLTGHSRWITSVTMDHYRVMSASLEGLRLWSFCSDDAREHDGVGARYDVLPPFVFPQSGIMYNSRRRLKRGDAGADAQRPVGDHDGGTDADVAGARAGKSEAARTVSEMIATGKAKFWKRKCEAASGHK